MVYSWSMLASTEKKSAINSMICMSKFNILSFICLLGILATSCNSTPSEFTIDVNSSAGENTGFWKASGTDLLFYMTEKQSGQKMLDRMEETGSCVYLRNHYTLTQHIREGLEVGIQVYSEDENGNSVYDFSRVNRLFGEYVKRGLKPVVECDYMPKGLTDRELDTSVRNDEGMSVKNSGPEDWNKWRDLLVAITENFIETFGAEEVRTWYFEVWNEPDGWKQSDIGTFYKLYDVFSEAVTSVDPELRVGGPACYHESFMKDFLDHVVYGTNYVTGKKGSRIDFVSYHIYGLSGGWLNSEPRIHPQVQRFTQSVLWMSRLFEKYDELKDVEFHVNEWGLSSHFQKKVSDYPDLVYRNTEESALFLVKLVDCLYAIEDNYDFPTSMLLYWGGAWEAEKDEFFLGHRALTTAGNIPKPMQTGYEMLAQLGDERLDVDGPPTGDRINVLATRSSDREIEMIVYNYDETDDDISISDKISIQISGLPDGSYSIEEYSMDRENNNTYREWERQGSPLKSGEADMASLQKAAELSVTKSSGGKSTNGKMQMKLALERHSMKLIIIKPE